MEATQKRRTITRSFRVDQEALETIEADASKKRISANTLVNQLLLSYANYDHFLQHPIIKMGSAFHEAVIARLSDADAIAVGKQLAENQGKIAILSRQGAVSLEGVLFDLRWLGDYSGAISYREAQVGARRTVTLVHNWGKKGSLFWGQFMLSLFELAEIHPKLTITESSAVVVL
jgi:hypothetical protein